MEKWKIYAGLIVLSFIGIITTILLSLDAEDITVPTIFIGINLVGIVVGIIILDNLDKKTPVSEKELDKLKSFGREGASGSYSDWWMFSLIPNKNGRGEVNRWSFCLFNEVDGKTTFVRYVDNMQQLKDVYKGITDKQLK